MDKREAGLMEYWDWSVVESGSTPKDSAMHWTSLSWACDHSAQKYGSPATSRLLFDRSILGRNPKELDAVHQLSMEAFHTHKLNTSCFFRASVMLRDGSRLNDRM